MLTFTLNQQLTACLKHCNRNGYSINNIEITADTVYYFIYNPFFTEEANKTENFYITIHTLIANK